MLGVDLGRLSHWSRVAFAARCARRVQPLFKEAWSDAVATRTEAVERAISLAELSAATRQPHEGLKEAILAAAGTAGAAQIPHICPFPLEDMGTPPIDRDAAVIASLTAKVAEEAAEAAATNPSQSIRPAHEAYHFALDALDAAGR